MVKIETPESDFINGKYCFEKNIRNLLILNEGRYVDAKDFDGNSVRKLELDVQFRIGDEAKTKKWQPNKKALGILKKVFQSEDSAAFVNKKIKINLTPFQQSYAIDVDEMDTIALNKPVGI